MQYGFLVAGVIFLVAGLVLEIYFRRTVKKRAEQFADEHLSEYQEDDIVPAAKVKEFFKKGARSMVSGLVIPLSLNLIGTVLIVIYIIIR